MDYSYRLALAGLTAGAVTGLFGAGGGMVLVPLLSGGAKLDDGRIFPTSVSIMLPVCIVSLICAAASGGLDWLTALPYLLGSSIGGFAAGIWGQRIPPLWLHRGLGVLILWGGIRYLC